MKIDFSWYFSTISYIPPPPLIIYMTTPLIIFLELHRENEPDIPEWPHINFCRLWFRHCKLLFMCKGFAWMPIRLLYFTRLIDHLKRDMIFFIVPVLLFTYISANYNQSWTLLFILKTNYYEKEKKQLEIILAICSTVLYCRTILYHYDLSANTCRVW